MGVWYLLGVQVLVGMLVGGLEVVDVQDHLVEELLEDLLGSEFNVACHCPIRRKKRVHVGTTHLLGV